MKDQWYVSLEPGVGDESPLIRQIGSDYKGKTFGEVVEYMLNPAGDSLNEPYSPMDRRCAQVLQRIYNTRDSQLLTDASQTHKSSTVILSASRVNEGEDLTLSFSDKVHDHLEDILKTQSVTGPDGKEEERQSVYLTMTKVDGGGI